MAEAILRQPERKMIMARSAQLMLASAANLEAEATELRIGANILLEAAKMKARHKKKPPPEEVEEPVFLADDEVVKRLEAMSPGMRAQFEQALRDVVGEA